MRAIMKTIKIKEKIRTEVLKLKSAFGMENRIFHLLDQMSGKLVDSVYGQDINLTVEIPRSNVEPFLKQLTEQSGGKIFRVD